jgi:excisionase family DNA binding protein
VLSLHWTWIGRRRTLWLSTRRKRQSTEPTVSPIPCGWYKPLNSKSSNFHGDENRENGIRPNLIEQLESRHGAMRVSDLAAFLGGAIDDKHIYRMAARGQLPSFRLGGAVCFDPQEVAKWLRSKYGAEKKPPATVRSSRSEHRSVA